MFYPTYLEHTVQQTEGKKTSIKDFFRMLFSMYLWFFQDKMYSMEWWP